MVSGNPNRGKTLKREGGTAVDRWHARTRTHRRLRRARDHAHTHAKAEAEAEAVFWPTVLGDGPSAAALVLTTPQVKVVPDFQQPVCAEWDAVLGYTWEDK